MNTDYRWILLVTGLFLTSFAAAEAAPGDLDPTFSGDGRLVDVWTGYDSGRAVVIQPDGRIVVAGGASGAFGIARYNPDGTSDVTFGSGTGKVTTYVGPSFFEARSVALQPDGKIMVAGCVCSFNEDPVNYFVVVRYNSNGSLDTTFAGDGIVTTLVGTGFSGAKSIAVQTDGKIVVGGFTGDFFSPERFALVRYNPNGSLDASFGVGGTITTSFEGYVILSSLVLQPDGKIIAAGNNFNKTGLFALVRYHPNGALDATFGNGGTVTTLMHGGANSLALQADGKIVAGGTSYTGSEDEVALVRYLPNGSLDATFGSDGKVTTPVGYGGGADSVKLQPDGKILATGVATYSTDPFGDFVLLRYNTDGALDRTFGGGDGITTADFDNASDGASAMALDNAGRAVVVGASNYSFAIARFLLASTPFDFDGDDKADVSVFRPSERIWYLDQSTAGFSATQFGLSTDKITPADYDGDGKTDISVYRDGTWYWLKSSNGSFNARQFGIASDIPVPGDYTGDGRDELAVYRGGTWWIYDLVTNQAQAIQFGLPSDKPVVADYDGDGRADQAVYRGNGEWHLNRSTLGYAVVNFGLATDRPVPADYDGDGKADLAVYRDGTWYLQQSTAGFTAFQWGIATDTPAPADYDGDGKTDAAIYRNGQWWLRQSTSGVAIHQFGLANDKPIPAAYLP